MTDYPQVGDLPNVAQVYTNPTYICLTSQQQQDLFHLQVWDGNPRSYKLSRRDLPLRCDPASHGLFSDREHLAAPVWSTDERSTIANEELELTFTSLVDNPVSSVDNLLDLDGGCGLIRPAVPLDGTFFRISLADFSARLANESNSAHLWTEKWVGDNSHWKIRATNKRHVVEKKMK